MQNGHVESFHGRLRDECLNTSWFLTLGDVRQKLADWRQEYNSERPHSSLDYRTPDEFNRACDESRAMALLSSQTSVYGPGGDISNCTVLVCINFPDTGSLTSAYTEYLPGTFRS
jgi:hypothetical protein